MASPPFNINQSLPGDSDIVSQHPSNARTFRDVVESWFLALTGNNTNGNNNTVVYEAVSTPAGSSSKLTTWIDAAGNFLKRFGTAPVEYIGVRPGAICLWPSSTVPAGWLIPNGQAVSRSTYADLFAVCGTTFGAGDGSTTFNLPNMMGRVPIGYDPTNSVMASVVTDTGTINPNTINSKGGSSTHVQTSAEMAAHAHGTTESAHFHGSSDGVWARDSHQSAGTGGPKNSIDAGSPGQQITDAVKTNLTVNSAGGSNAMSLLQLSIVMNWIIKY